MKKKPLVWCCVLTLSACSGSSVSETLGLNRESPDEFVVVSRPPLSVPPDFNLLPPEEGKAGPAASATQQARASLLGSVAQQDESAPPSDALTSDFTLESDATTLKKAAGVTAVSSASLGSAADAMFLEHTGANKADDNIRAKLGADKYAKNPRKKAAKSLYEQIIADEKAEPVIDAKKEAARIRNNKETGKAPNAGEIKTIDTKPTSVFDRIF